MNVIYGRSSVTMLFLLAACAVLSMNQLAFGQSPPVIIRVDGVDGVATPIGANPGNTWPNAYKFLQDAIARASVLLDPENDENVDRVEIWVRGRGLNTPIYYRPDQSAANPTGTNDRDASFVLIPNVYIYGGFVGTETLLSQRNPDLLESVLTGEIGNQALLTDNSYAVVRAFDGAITPQNTRLDGFVIEKGFQATNIAGGPEGGAGIHCVSASPRIHRCVIRENQGKRLGGGVALYCSSAVLTRCTVKDNQCVAMVFPGAESGVGGGVGVACAHVENQAEIINCTLTHNQANLSGGGIGVADAARARIINCIIAENRVGSIGQPGEETFIPSDHGRGGGVAVTKLVDFSVFQDIKLVEVVNCTIVFNHALAYGGGFYHYSENGTWSSIVNSILWENAIVEDNPAGSGGPQIYQTKFGPAPDLDVTYSDVQMIGHVLTWPGTGNINAAPQFVAVPSYNPSHGPADYRLRCTSPAISAGNPDQSVILNDIYDVNENGNTAEKTPDMALQARVLGGRVEIGAYERLQPHSCAGDVDNNNVVNVSDLLGVINSWGTCPAPPASCLADIAPFPCGNGAVDVSDLLLVINNWGVNCVSGLVGDVGSIRSVQDCMDLASQMHTPHSEEWTNVVNKCVSGLCAAGLIECDE